MKESVHKVVLSSGKEVLMRDMKIKYQNLALKAVGSKAGDNNSLLGSMMQQELVKILIVQVDGQAVDPKAMEDLDSLFSYQEYLQIVSFVGQLMGGNSLGEFKNEIVNIGDN